MSGRGDRTLSGCRTPPTENLSALRAKTRNAHSETQNYTAPKEQKVPLGEDECYDSVKASSLVFRRPLGLRWPGDRKKPSSRAKGSPKAAGQKQLFSLSLADAELFEMRIREDRPGITLWRDAVRRSKSGAGKARVETGAGTAPRTASAPPPSPTHASFKHPPPRLRVQGRRLQPRNWVKRSRNPGPPTGDNLRPRSPTHQKTGRRGAR